tara:strand:+ start:3498 stop:4646 length:1149 start_codon:yes stop_codon:yes gene_type:complete
MSRNRVIYQSEALFASKEHTSTSATEHEQLHRVQSANYGFSVNRQDVNQFGNLARIDSIILEAPTVNFDVTYYPTNGFNEKALDFFVRDGNTDPNLSGQFASGHLAAGSGKNFYILTVPEGRDANLNRQNGETENSVIGIGNAFLTDYTLDLSVGSLPTATVSFEASNIIADTAVSGSTNTFSGIVSPGVDPELGESIGLSVEIPVASGHAGSTDSDLVSALRPGDIKIDISSFQGDTLSSLIGTDGVHLQSASLSIPLSRSPIERLGSKFPFARTVDFPVNATLNVNAIVNTLEAQNLANVISGCGETNRRDIKLTLNECGLAKTGMEFLLKGCTVDSESFSSSIGSNKSVDITFSTQIGGTRDPNNGIFVSGSNTTVPYV